MIPFTVCPATCELCGNWLPQHQTSCPRNGVHPSQWTCSFSDSISEQEEYSLIPTTIAYQEKDSYHRTSLSLSPKEEVQVFL